MPITPQQFAEMQARVGATRNPHRVRREILEKVIDNLRHENNPLSQLQNPIPQCDQAPTLGRTEQGEAQGLGRITVRFTGYRVRPLDPDNFAGSVKDLLDGLRHAGLIPGDEPWKITLQTDQVKVNKFEDEKTVIEIVWPNKQAH